MLIKKLIFVSFFFFLISFSSSLEISNELLEKFEEQDLVRVSIQLNPQENFFLRAFGLSQEKENLDLEKVKYSDSDSIVAFISKSELEDLKENSLVKSIVPEIYLNFFLHNSNIIQNVTPVWDLQINNINLTGKGQTVCIIDSGIDYTHPSLGGCYGENNPNSNCKVIGGWDFCADDGICSTQDSDPFDVNGHGTHVAGIISSNNTLFGVAPESKIIAIKASNSTGSFALSDLKKGLEWCIDNSTKFNISVISMSLGGGFWTDTNCDSFSIITHGPNWKTYQDIADLFEIASEKNISITVATGNDHANNPNKISFPSCISSAIAVSSSTKQLSLSPFANRNSLVKLLGLGSSINSTKLGGGFVSASGTSMATPMIAGAILIYNQYLELSNQEMTPFEIEEHFYQKGQIISENNINYSLLDLYSSIFIEKPLIEINDSYTNESINFTIKYSSSFDLNLNLFCYNNLLNKSKFYSSINILNSSFFDFNYSYNFSSLGLEYCNLSFSNSFEEVYFWESYYDVDKKGFIGGLENIKTNLNDLNFSLSQNNASFYRNNTKIFFFNYNFSLSPLNFDKIFVYSQEENDSYSYLIVSGLNLTLQNKTKTLILDRILNGTGVCLKDSFVSNLTDISKDCDLENEIFLLCPGVVQNYSCEINSDEKYVISGLNHSGVKEMETFCGDGICNGEETCLSCPTDCGSCLSPPRTTSSTWRPSSLSLAPEEEITNNITYTLEYFDEELAIENETKAEIEKENEVSSKEFTIFIYYFLSFIFSLIIFIFAFFLYLFFKNKRKNTSNSV